MIIADVPGVSKDRCHVNVCDDYVIIEGKRKRKVITSEDTYLISERQNGEFKKSIQIPIDSDPQLMTAKLEDGLLVLTIPRTKNTNGITSVNIQ